MMQDFYNPQNLNRYAYCINNPLIYADPSGQFFSEIFESIGNFFGGIFGGKRSDNTGGPYIGNLMGDPYTRTLNGPGTINFGQLGGAKYETNNDKINITFFSPDYFGGYDDSESSPYTYEADSLMRYSAINAGESHWKLDPFNEGMGIGNVQSNRMQTVGAFLESGFEEKIGGKRGFDAIRDHIYMEVVNMSLDLALNSRYGAQIRGGIAALSPFSEDITYGALHFNATHQKNHPEDYDCNCIGWNWTMNQKGILRITNTIGGTTFFEYSDKRQPNRW
jgi:hypothetical protein